jgi:hypothetical protein
LILDATQAAVQSPARRFVQLHASRALNDMLGVIVLKRAKILPRSQSDKTSVPSSNCGPGLGVIISEADQTALVINHEFEHCSWHISSIA